MRQALARRRLCGVVVVVVSCAIACGPAGSNAPVRVAHPLFGVTQPLSEALGTDIRSSQVVPMRCIPSRSDPVAVTLALEITEWLLRDNILAVRVRTGEVRLGSHPSGCSAPRPLIDQSLFLLGPGDTTLLAADSVEDAEGTTVIFDLGERMASAWSMVLLPTLEFTAGDGGRQTRVLGLMGFYHLA